MAKQMALQERFVGERARALAIVYLTRREDLIVAEGGADMGVNFWVTHASPDKAGHRRFGVTLQGIPSPVLTAENANGFLRPTMRKMLRLDPDPAPLVLFFFTMQMNEAWYTWIAEPRVGSDGDFQIVRHGEASCRPLDAGALDEIVESVDRWYDAFFTRVVRVPPTKPRAKTSRT